MARKILFTILNGRGVKLSRKSDNVICGWPLENWNRREVARMSTNAKRFQLCAATGIVSICPERICAIVTKASVWSKGVAKILTNAENSIANLSNAVLLGTVHALILLTTEVISYAFFPPFPI